MYPGLIRLLTNFTIPSLPEVAEPMVLPLVSFRTNLAPARGPPGKFDTFLSLMSAPGASMRLTTPAGSSRNGDWSSSYMNVFLATLYRFLYGSGAIPSTCSSGAFIGRITSAVVLASITGPETRIPFVLAAGVSDQFSDSRTESRLLCVTTGGLLSVLRYWIRHPSGRTG